MPFQTDLHSYIHPPQKRHPGRLYEIFLMSAPRLRYVSVSKKCPEQTLCCLVLDSVSICLIQATEFNKRNLQPVIKILRRKTGLLIQNQIEIRPAIVLYSSKFLHLDILDCPNSCTVKEITAHSHLTSRENSVKINDISLLFVGSSREYKDCRTYHRWFRPFWLRIHNRDAPEVLLRLAAYTLHICAKKCIHTGNTDHHHRRLLLKTFADFFHCFWDFLKMTSCHNISFVHHQVKKSIVIFTHGTDQDEFRPQYPGATNQHDRTRTASPTLLTPNPSAPGEFAKGKVAGEL